MPEWNLVTANRLIRRTNFCRSLGVRLSLLAAFSGTLVTTGCSPIQPNGLRDLMSRQPQLRRKEQQTVSELERLYNEDPHAFEPHSAESAYASKRMSHAPAAIASAQAIPTTVASSQSIAASYQESVPPVTKLTAAPPVTTGNTQSTSKTIIAAKTAQVQQAACDHPGCNTERQALPKLSHVDPIPFPESADKPLRPSQHVQSNNSAAATNSIMPSNLANTNRPLTPLMFDSQTRSVRAESPTTLRNDNTWTTENPAAITRKTFPAVRSGIVSSDSAAGLDSLKVTANPIRLNNPPLQSPRSENLRTASAKKIEAENQSSRVVNTPATPATSTIPSKPTAKPHDGNRAQFSGIKVDEKEFQLKGPTKLASLDAPVELKPKTPVAMEQSSSKISQPSAPPKPAEPQRLASSQSLANDFQPSQKLPSAVKQSSAAKAETVAAKLDQPRSFSSLNQGQFEQMFGSAPKVVSNIPAKPVTAPALPATVCPPQTATAPPANIASNKKSNALPTMVSTASKQVARSTENQFLPVGFVEPAKPMLPKKEIEKSVAIPISVPPKQPTTVSQPITQPVAKKELSQPANRTITPSKPESMKQAVPVVALAPQLKLSAAQFCTEIRGFGQVTPFASTRFHSQQKTLVYCEIENYQAIEQSSPQGQQFVTRLRGRYVIRNGVDQVVQSGVFPDVEDITYRRRRDFYLYFPVTMQSLPRGEYRLELEIEDLGQSVSQSSSAKLEPQLRFSVE